MPIFYKKKHFKHTPTRTGRLSEAACPRIIDNNADIRLLVEEKELRFVDGIWVQHTNGAAGTTLSRATELPVDDLPKLKAKMDKLEQENNLLQVKVDILVDMLAENISKIETEK